MEMIEEEERLGSVGKTQHIRFSRRDTIANDFRNSTIEGLVSILLSFFALVLVFLAVYESYKSAGNAGYLSGAACFTAVVFAILGIIFGIKGLRNRKKIRHYMEGRGIVLGILVILAAAAIFLYGLKLMGY